MRGKEKVAGSNPALSKEVGTGNGYFYVTRSINFDILFISG